MKKRVFVTTIDELEELMCQYDLEDCGMSGKYFGWHWYSYFDEEILVDVYFKLAG